MKRCCYWHPAHVMPPPVFESGRDNGEKKLDLSSLPKDLRQPVWELIKRDKPSLARLIEDIKEVRKAFNGSICVPMDELPESVLKLLQ